MAHESSVIDYHFVSTGAMSRVVEVGVRLTSGKMSWEAIDVRRNIQPKVSTTKDGETEINESKLGRGPWTLRVTLLDASGTYKIRGD